MVVPVAILSPRTCQMLSFIGFDFREVSRLSERFGCVEQNWLCMQAATPVPVPAPASKGGLGGGAIAGIAIGAGAGIAAILGTSQISNASCWLCLLTKQLTGMLVQALLPF